MNKNSKDNTAEYKWYPIRVVTGKERKTKELLETELKIEGMDKWVRSVMIPMEKEYKMKDGKKVGKEKMIFPGYLLVEAILTGEAVRTIKNCNGVAGFTTDGKNGSPIPLRKAEVDNMLGRIEETHNAENYIIGEIVKIIDGPFNTFKGSITEYSNEKRRLKVDVIIFGRNTPVDLTFEQIEKEKV